MAKRPSKPKEPDVAPSKAVELGPECPVALFVGPEAFLRQYYTDDLRTKIEKSGAAVEVLRFDGESATVADVLDECRSMGLMAQHKVVVVDNADQFVKEPGETDEDDAPAADQPGSRAGSTRRELLERYAEAPCPNATLVLRAEKNWRPGKLDKLIARRGVVMPCKTPDGPAILRWMVGRARNVHTRELEPKAAEALLDAIGPELSRLDAELAKIASGLKPGETITIDLVARLVTPRSLEDKPYALSPFLLAPDPSVGLTKLREMIELAGMSSIPLRWAMIDTALKLHSLSREVAQGVSPQAAGRTLNLWGEAGQAVRAAGVHADPAAAARLVGACVESDMREKTGQGDPELGLELLCLSFTRLVRGAQRAAARR